MRKLLWDSDFWGIEIFNLDSVKDLSSEKVAEAPFLIQALPNVSDSEFIHSLEVKGFQFQESKVTLHKNQLVKTYLREFAFKSLTPQDIEPYKYIFYELYGMNSRYNVFQSKSVNDFYYTWILNSIFGKMDDACVGYFINEDLAGFVTYRIRKDVITIGLLGVLPEFQGCGISQLLLNYIDNLALKNNIYKISIATQGKNINALNAYIKNGYKIHSIDHWYYYLEGVKK